MPDLYDSGLCTLCKAVNVGEAGQMPKLVLQPQITSYFEEKTIGITRIYLAKGANENIDLLVQVRNEGYMPRIGDFAVLTNYEHQQDTENGDQYRIQTVQPQKDSDGLPVILMQLERMNDNYDLYRVIQ